MANNLFIDPTNLSSPSSPSSSSCTHEDIDPTHSAGPARKRVRTPDKTSEDRKEARAHRNRIAAQNSRDRRKAHFAYLEQRVAELEEENRQLRVGTGIRPAEPTRVHRQDRTASDLDHARERENEELKERIRTLEKGWDVVLKALAAQGLPTGPSSAPTSTTDPSITRSPSPTEPSVPLPNGTGPAFFPSPASSHSSLEAESTTTLTAAILSGNPSSGTGAKEASEHVSPGGLIVCADTALSTDFLSSDAGTTSQAGRKLSITVTPTTSTTNTVDESSGFEDDDKVMEALFREIVTSPCTAQDATAESGKISVAGSESAEVMVGCGDETGSRWDLVEMGDCPVRATQLRAREGNEDCEYRDYEEWTTEMETERMLDEIIAMTGLVEGGETFADIGVGLGLGVDPSVNLDLSTLSGWDMDAAIGCIGAH